MHAHTQYLTDLNHRLSDRELVKSVHIQKSRMIIIKDLRKIDVEMMIDLQNPFL